MIPRRRPLLIVVTGATASGKTSLAIELAERLGCEIISADSRQLFKDIPIGTAAPSPAELERVKHHLIATLSLDDYYSAAQFECDALAILPDIFKHSGGYAVVCGGSMMYVDALVRGIDEMPTVSDSVRKKVDELLICHGTEGLAALLEILDPDYYAEVDKSNTKRIAHAIEISMEAGVPYSTLRTGQSARRDFDIIKLAIDWPREELFERINQRVNAMIDNGMVDEARAVYPLRHLNSLNTVGYKELFAYFDGTMDFDTAVARIKKNTRVYAKKQLTWLRRDASVQWISPSTTADEIITGICGIESDRFDKRTNSGTQK